MRPAQHPLEIEFGIPAATILDIIGIAHRVKPAVRGAVAERHLKALLDTNSRLEVRHVARDNAPDFEIRYRRRRKIVRVECKVALNKPDRDGNAVVDFQKTRASTTPCSRFYTPHHFEILAACLHPLTNRREFRFRKTSTLAAHPNCPGHIAPRVHVHGDEWNSDIETLLEELSR